MKMDVCVLGCSDRDLFSSYPSNRHSMTKATVCVVCLGTPAEMDFDWMSIGKIDYDVF